MGQNDAFPGDGENPTEIEEARFGAQRQEHERGQWSNIRYNDDYSEQLQRYCIVYTNHYFNWSY